MKLLFDEQLSPALLRHLAATFPGCTHVDRLGLGRASDRQVWEHARNHELIVVTKDVDFVDLQSTLGHPPKVIWRRVGNCSTADLRDLLARNVESILAFAADADVGVLQLG